MLFRSFALCSFTQIPSFLRATVSDLFSSLCEGIALIALYKRATVSEHFHHSVKSKVSVSLVIRANRSLEKISIFRMFFTAFPHVMPKSPSLPSLFTLSLFFKSDGSDWLFFSRIALSLKKNNRFARKTKEEIPSPGYSHELCFAR